MISPPLPVVRAACLESEPAEQRWLIEGLWARAAIGLIGGAPKCCKTWFGLDLAVSVATGTRALGHFETSTRGPALIYLAEDGLPQVRSRIDALCRHRGIDISALDLHVITAPVLRLDLRSDQERLAEAVERLRPRLLLLDPLVRLHRLDENSAAEISGLLGYIRDLQRRFDAAVVLVHHASKKQRSQPGQALRGSSDLHAIGDCNAYLARHGNHIVLTIEHRAARSPEPLTLDLVADANGNATHLRVRADTAAAPPQTRPLEEQVLALLVAADGPMTRTALRARLGINNQRLGIVLNQLEHTRRVSRTERGWTTHAVS
ncbi:MAG: AAA family ATPase [Planctomycetes bacterium]|nr:AAA family ATPase [Planctomycetota bacterium]